MTRYPESNARGLRLYTSQVQGHPSFPGRESGMAKRLAIHFFRFSYFPLGEAG